MDVFFERGVPNDGTMPSGAYFMPTGKVRFNAAGNVSQATLKRISKGINGNQRGGFFLVLYSFSKRLSSFTFSISISSSPFEISLIFFKITARSKMHASEMNYDADSNIEIIKPITAGVLLVLVVRMYSIIYKR